MWHWCVMQAMAILNIMMICYYLFNFQVPYELMKMMQCYDIP
jgi:hypothetical protein